MFRHIKFLGRISVGVKNVPNIRCRESQCLVRLYTSKKDPSNCDLKKPVGKTKLVSECLPTNSKESSKCQSKNESNKGRTLAPNECRQTAKNDVPIYDKDCKRPHIDTSPPQPEHLQPDCKPPGIKNEDCRRPNILDQSAKSGTCEDSSKIKQNKYGVFLFLGALFAAGGLYQLWSMDYFGTSEKQSNAGSKKTEEKKTEKKQKKKDRWPVVPLKVPETSRDIPSSVPYLLIGGGTASFACFRAIKSSDPKAQILVIGNERYLPYMRPPLSKEMWYGENREEIEKLTFKQWNGTERSLYYEPSEFYTECKSLMDSKNGGVAIARGWNVARLNVNKQIAYLDDGKEIHYQKCLIATGGVPTNLPVFEQASAEVKQRVTLFRDVTSFQKLEDVVSDGAKSIAIIGGGFLGSELACALARRGKKQDLKVSQIFKEPGNMAKILPKYLSQWTTEKVQKEGVEVIASAEVDDVKFVNNQLVISLTNGKNIRAEHVIVAVGNKPNTNLADDESGLEVDPELGGYLVNAELEARSNLYVAGDCACFYDVKLGRRRVEHHDHAVVTGRLAGENMAGASKPYLHQSMFWSDLGPDVGYEAVGLIDSNLSTVGVYAKSKETEQDTIISSENKSDSKESTFEKENYDKGVIFYIRQGVIVGIVLWNIFNRMQTARQILHENKKYEDLNEVAKLFNIHGE